MRLITTFSVLVALIQAHYGLGLMTSWEMSTTGSGWEMSLGSWPSSTFPPLWVNSDDSVTQIHCPAEQVFCLEYEMCMSLNDDGCKPTDGLQDPSVTCPSGYVFCIEKGECIRQNCKDTQTPTMDINAGCPTDYVFCIEKGECIRQNCKDTPTPKMDINAGCPTGYVFCMESESCVSLEKTCKTTKTSHTPYTCPFGYVFCIERDGCVSLEENCQATTSSSNTPDSCPPGYVYCLETETCILHDYSCESSTEGTDDSLGCQPGYVYCLDQEMCVPFQERCDSPTQPSSTDHSCPSGHVYCLDFENCIPVNSYCEISTSASSSDHSCPPGYVFCLVQEMCVLFLESCDSTTQSSSSDHSCLSGYVYCLDSEMCIPVNSHCEMPTPTITSDHSCPPDYVYCLDWEKCVLQTKGCDTVTIPTTGTTNDPNGYVYCLDWEKFAPYPETCDTSTQMTTSGQICPPGQVYCLQEDACTQMCTPSNESGSNHSITHCPHNYVYCLLTETCVNRECSTVPPTTVPPTSSTETSAGDELAYLLPFVAILGKTHSFVPKDVLPYDSTENFPNFTLSCPNEVLEGNIIFQVSDGVIKQNVTMVTADTNVSITVIKTEKGWVECTIQGIHVFGVTTFRLNMTVVILTAPSYIVPEISLVKEIMFIAEDTELLFSGYLDIFNATEIERAVKGLDDAMTKIDPNNFMGINATGTVASFKRMLQEIKANISRSGIHMNVKYEPNADQVVRILRKANSDKEWSLVRSAEVVFTLQDMGSMRFVPATDYVGNITITFDPYSGLQEAHGKGLILTVVVTPTNDAPLLKDEVRTSLLQYRYNTIQYPYSGVGHFKAGSIASQLYRDMEGDMISIAVIGAIQTNLGQWVVGQDGDLAEILLFDMRKLKEAGQITQKAVLVNPTSEVRFLLRNSSYMWQRYENPRLFIAAIDAGVIPKLDAFRVVEINISICREGTTWEQQLCIVDSSSSYSRTVLDLYMGRQGCDGIAGSTLMEDKCGVCGGKNDCFDCNGDPNGTAYYDPCDLSKCVGGNTGIKSNENLDCAGVKCGKHYIHDKFGCIPVSTDVVALNLTLPCDGQLLSDAFINECEICVVGATGLAADAGMDACGVCHGDNSTCMDCAQDVKGDKVVDFCGKCRSPSDPQFNKGCGASLGTVYPKFIFAKYEGNLSVAGANLEAFSDARCYVHSAAQTRQFLETLDFNASSGIIKLSLPNITSSFNGEYFVSCDLNSNKSLNVTDGKIYLYGNPTLLSLEPKDITVGNITSVTIKGKNITDTGKVYCVLKCQEIRPEYGCQSIDNKVSGFVNFSAKLINSATVLCDLSRLSKVKSARVYNLSVVTGELSDVDLNSLSYVNLRVTSAAPKPLQAQYDDTMCNIQVTFDEGIAIREDIINPTCADIFDEDTKKFLEGAECRVHGQMLSISPRSASTTYIGKLLTFKSGIIKRFSTSEDVAEYATGTLTILQPSSPIVPELILRSPSLISTCDAVSIKAHVQKRGCLTYTFSWKVTGTRKDPTAMDTGDKVSALMRKIAQLANDVILVNGSELSAGFDFNFAVNLTTQFGDIVTAEKILSLDDTVLIVPDLKVLGGVQEVNPTEKIIITSSIKKSACIADTQGNALYAWSIDAAIDSDINSMKPRTVIPGNTLRGGKTYTVTFTVTFTTITGETITGAASVSFKTTSSPLQPIINNGENFQHLIGNDLILNASLSYDPDKQTGVPTTYVWGCQEKFGDGNFYPCWTFDPSTKTPKIFTMAEGIITTFPKMMMREGSEFKFILTMQKDARNASTISTVKIVASDAPQIVHIRHTELINTNDYLVINTIVRAMRNGTIFAMVSNGDKDYEERALRKASTDLVKKTDKLMVWDRFDLVIPGNVFIPGATYNFMAIGIGGNSKDIEVREEFKSRVNSKPKVGTAMITPTSGVSMQTVFTVAIDDEWIDYEDEKNLQYYLYYWDGKERKQIGIHSTAGEKSLNLRLPAGQFEIMVEGCDSMQSCSEYRIPTTINVTTWNDHNRTDLLLQMARDAVETGDENGVNILLEVKSILEKQNLNSTLIETVLLYIDQFMEQLLPASTNFVSYDKAGVKESLKAINKLLSGMGSRLSKQARNKCLKAVNDIIKSYSAGSSKGRRKRALSQDNPVSGMSVSMAETILNTFSNVFLDQSEDEVSSPDSLTFQSTLDAIMVGLCVTLKSYSVSPLVVKTNLAVVRAEKKNMSGMAGTEFEIGCSDCPDILNAPAKIQYGEEIARTYTNWNCSQDYLCLGLCLASAQITVDFISASGSPVLLFQDIHKRRSDLVNIKIFNPETNSAINLPELVIPVIISFKMNNTVDMTKNTLKCKVWNGEHWSEGKCDIRVPMKALITDGDIVNCLCTVLGIISLFEQNRTEVYTMEPPITTSVASPASSSHPSSGHATNGESTTTTGASTSPRSADLSNPNATRKVTFTLEHDYASIVGENKQEFHSSMISQLAKILGIFPSRIINFSSKPGSIIVIFEILPPSNGSEKTTIDAVNILGFLITSNAINLTTSNGTILKVQVSSFRIIDETTEPDSDIVPVFLPYIIGGVIGGAVVIGLAVLILVVLMKMKQKQKTYPNVTMPTGFSNAEQVKQAGMVSVLPISAKPSANKWIENELYPAVNEMDSLKQNKMNFDLADGGQYARQGPTLAIVDEDKGIQYRSIELDGNNTISTDPTNAATTARIGSASSSKSTSSRKDIPQVVI